jgi:serine/threonine protein kinase
LVSSQFGRFALKQKLAPGGMGEVWLASCDGAGGLPKVLVIKRLLPHLERDKEFLDLFLNEARIAARLSHPNVARTFELGQADGRWYLAMEYVDGHSLRDVLERARNEDIEIGLPLSLYIAAQAAAGLAHAHKASDEQGRPLQVVHLDVSPHNLLLSFTGEVKVIDFGIARAARRSKAVEEEVLRGKYPYMSPEQVSGGEVDHRSDQFSLGAVLWEMLTGRRLFNADAPARAIELVQRCEVAPPSKHIGQLPRGVDEAVLRALKKNPAERFPDIAAFGLALNTALSAMTGGRHKSDLSKLIEDVFPSSDEVTIPSSAPRGPVQTVKKASMPPRHVIDAWTKLSNAAKSTLMQLAVFPRNFGVEAAEAVVDLSAEKNPPFVLDVLETLRAAGLIDATSMLGPQAELAFVLPPAVKEFAEEKLREAPAALRDGAKKRLASAVS